MNTTAIGNISSLQGIAYYTNNNTEGILFGGGLVVLFFIILMVTVRNEEVKFASVAVASWSTFLIGLFFWFAHLVPALEIIIFLVITVISTIMLFTNK